MAIFQPPESANSSNKNNLIPEVSLPVSIAQSKTAINVSRGSVSAADTTAQENDIISYAITIKNKASTDTTVKFEDHLADVLEYAILSDNGGGSFNKATNILSWPDEKLAPYAEDVRTFTVRVLDAIPATAQGISNPSSYDCIMTNAFGNTIALNVNCPTPKIVEQITSKLPKTSVNKNILFSSIIFIITLYFYARTRQIKQEIKLIRHSLNAGTI